MASRSVLRASAKFILALAVLATLLTRVPHNAFAADESPDFLAQIQPILRSRCHSCHGSESQEAGLRLDRRQRALAGSDSGRVIVAGDVVGSSLLRRIQASDPDERMPPTGTRLSDKQIKLLTDWIAAGAEWPEDEHPESPQEHWAYQPIGHPAMPQVAAADWMRNGVDAFILRRLEQEGVRPSAEADRSTLIRRAYLDLIGLPASPAEWQRWTTDRRSDWYERMVDELLTSPHFGERWGRFWLDQARYADSDGYEKDQPRPHAFRWRDWVIGALNSDLPFDEFTEQQLAGDLLPGATPEVKLATGFHRNTLTNREGGIDKEEDRVKQVVDRVNTVASVWLGLTVKCAQCHTHKYDPITQREYFQLYSFFNQSDEHDFSLSPTAVQQRLFAAALATHQKQLKQARTELNAIQTSISQNLPRIERRLVDQHPAGAAAPDDELLSHVSFENPHERLANRVGLLPAEFQGSGAAEYSEFFGRQALTLNGKDQRLVLGPLLEANSRSSFTLACWVNLAGGTGGLLTKMDEAADFRGIDFTSNNGILEVHLVDTWPRDAIKVTTKERVPPNEWHHVLMTYDGSQRATGIRIYFDGQPQELTVHYDQLTGSLQTAEPFRAGSRKNGTYLHGKIGDIRIYGRALAEVEVAVVSRDRRLAQFLAVAQIAAAARTAQQRAAQIEYVISTRPAARAVQGRVTGLERKPPQMQRGTGMGLRRRDSYRRTFVHVRGEFLRKGDEVGAGIPAFLHEMRPRGPLADRLDLARWILAEENTLTPRVTVNRLWQQLFGRGIVESDQDFGSQGAEPSHPELLDWLATCFVRQQWSVKQLLRTIVTSATYRQSSRGRSELRVRDPYNRWLARQNRKRVEAETVRDLALCSSGLLVRKLKGPSVFPPLPAGIIELAFVDVINRGPWRVNSGEDRYRRGLYTFYQRTSPYPQLTLFDAPDSNTACTRRERSNTPLQALTLWNDPVFMQCAKAMAIRILQERRAADESEGRQLPRRIRYAFLLCLGRLPDEEELVRVRELYTDSRSAYESDSQLTSNLLGDDIPSGLGDRPIVATWVAVARTLMNLDGFIVRE